MSSKKMAGSALSVLITGASSGIGLGIAGVFARQGHRLMLCGIETVDSVKPTMEKLKSESKRANPIIDYVQIDLTKPNDCREIVRKTVAEFRSIDVLVNNAGRQHTASVEDFPEKDWHSILALNLSAGFFLSQAALPHMRKQKFGRLIHIGSVHSLVASMNKSAYVAAKHGVAGLSKVIALETAGTGITSNVICPGWVKTPLVIAQIEKLAKDEDISVTQAESELLALKQPSKQFANPEQIGALALFLASDEAAQITGAQITMDGGWTAQ